MALPKANVVPTYECKVPSTGKTIVYRPYLVKEEKILLMAYESKDTRAILRAMMDTIAACIESDIDVTKLATFDVEYLFLQIRGKSVGETSEVVHQCKKCDAPNTVNINLDDVTVKVPKRNNIVELTDTISVEMKWPSYGDMMESELTEEGHEFNTSDILGVLMNGIGAILTEEERYDVADSTKEELEEFIDNLTSSQFQKLGDYFSDMPALKHSVKYKCEKCGTSNTVNMEGLADFF